MNLELRHVAIGRPPTGVLPPLSVALRDEAPTVVAVGTERGPMLASLIAAGRLLPDAGEVLLDGRSDAAAVRAAVALVDTPVVAEPPTDLAVAAVVREDLLYAGVRATRRDALDLLSELGIADWARAPIGTLPPTDRIRLLLTLAAARPGVRALVLTSPERHGGSTAEWLEVAERFTAAGTPVLVIGGHAIDPAVRTPDPVLSAASAASSEDPS